MENGKIVDYMRLYQNIETAGIKGIGAKTIEYLKELKISRVIDLLYYFPRNYEDRTNIKKIKDLIPEEFAVISGNILKAEIIKTRNKGNVFKIVITDESGLFEAVWFKMPFLKNTLTPGKKVLLTGKVKSDFGLKMSNPEYRIIKDEEPKEGKILPVYSLTSAVTQNLLRKLIYSAINSYSGYLYEVIPDNILKKYGVMDRAAAVKAIHFPENSRESEEAKRRFAIEELLILEMGIISKRFEIEMKNSEKYSLEDNKELVKKFLKNIGFGLTKAQKRVITEIYKDLNNGKIVNRLIQGDVGSGKTIVAVVMLLYMVENGYQGVFMAPTEILAEQHYLGLVDRLTEIGINVKILTASIKGKERARLLNEIEEGVADIVIGTHALIEENVRFKKLGLIVIDEQHRFGVMQRQTLREKGILANLVVMSATPIPRSLALSIYGDLDVSIIDELPPGRKPIKTKWLKNEGELQKAYSFMKKRLDEGRQCYVVCPLIDDSEKVDLTSVESLYAELKEDYFKGYEVAMLHGRMKNEEREEVMRNFKKNKIQILAATTVIEVGVNVPNASVMLIVDAQQFGLAQLHQLRGRVGRGEYESYCFMMAQTDNEFSRARLKIMETTTDGFKIAEEDLKLRKPGEIFGTRQSGIGDLKFADIVNDIKSIKIAKDETYEYLRSTNGKIENKFLEKEIKIKFEEEWVRN